MGKFGIDSIFSLGLFYSFLMGQDFWERLSYFDFLDPLDVQKIELHNHWKSKDHEHK